MNRICARTRRVLSADMDGEAGHGDARSAARHLTGCADCAAWLEAAHRVNRRAVLTTAVAPPDVTTDVLRGLRRRRRPHPMTAWLRAALVSSALIQVQWTLSGLARDRTHVSREMVAFDIALALGVLAVAARPSRASGMLPLLTGLVALLVITTGLDLADGTTTWTGELPHLLVVVELVTVWALRRTTGAVGFLPAGPTGTTVLGSHRHAA